MSGPGGRHAKQGSAQRDLALRAHGLNDRGSDDRRESNAALPPDAATEGASARVAPHAIAIHGAYARLTLETLDRAIGGDRAIAVIERALELAQVHGVPEEPRGYALFVCGALFDALTERYTESKSQSLVDDLSAYFERTGADASKRAIRRRREPRVESTVVIGTNREGRGDALRAALSDRDVYVVHNVFTLAQVVEEHLDRPVTVVVDESLAGLRGPMLGSIARVLPPTAQFVFCGEGPDDLTDISLRHEVLPSEASIAAIVECCERVVASEVPPARPLVVVADPDDVWRTTLAARLDAEGYAVIACADGFDALEACVDQDPELVVVDVAMPSLSGPQLGQLLQAREGDDAPQIVLSSQEESAPGTSGVRVIHKGDDFSDVLDQIRKRVPLRR